MRKLVILFVLFFVCFYAQNSYQIYYEVQFRKDSTENNYLKDFFILDISDKERKFYNVDYFINDSINKFRNRNDVVFTYPNLDIRLSSMNDKENFFINYYLHTPTYYSVVTEDKQNWEILSDKKKIGEFNAQKAITKYGGREWEAWFTDEFPFVYGPYKFHGLPGLILEISDTKGNYVFKFIGSKVHKKTLDTTRFLESHMGNKPYPITEEKWKELQLDYFTNPLKGFGNDGLYIENSTGEIVRANDRDVIKQMQNDIKKNNNPIEIDKAVIYP